MAQVPVSFAFYNVENLYDTIPSPFYDDSEYTPSGQYEWNTARYGAKITNIARVIDDMGVDVIALAEVENETVVRDLVTVLSTDYCYIHRTSSDRRGMDVALLYKGDRFFPEQIRLVPSGSSREFLYVRGTLCGERCDLLAFHLPSRWNSRGVRHRAMATLCRFADSLVRADTAARIVLMGDFNSDPSEPPFRTLLARGSLYGDHYRHPIEESFRMGGSYAYRGRWQLPDNILLSEAFFARERCRYMKAGVFIRDYMLVGYDSTVRSENAKWVGYPKRSFRAGRFVDGYSDHLPVFVILYR